MVAFDPKNLQRRVAGFHDQRLDGVVDILSRCNGASVMDIGCNRGLVAQDFARNGARVIHGCDNFEEGIAVARHNFIDMRYVTKWQFEVVDLTLGPSSLAPFGVAQYDIMVMLATFHKLRRIMTIEKLEELVHHFGKRTEKFFVWRGTTPKAETFDEFEVIDGMLHRAGLKNVQRSEISDIGPAGIWLKLN